MLRPNSLVGVSVLVVDDEVDARELVGTLLHAHGADVMTAGSAAQAIELVEKQVPTLIVSDIGMPAMDGYALIDRVRLLSRASKIPAIALTAYAREEDRRRALQGGFQAYLPKPVEPDALVRMVGDVARTGTVGSS
jgi:CheY-like chemotaxis protein